MSPILYEKHETDFNHNGLGKMNECLSATVTEVANSEFELEVIYPISGRLYDYIEDHVFIKAKPNSVDDPHVFRVYEHEIDTVEQTVIVHAHSRTNDLGYNMVTKVNVNSLTPQEAMNLMENSLVEPTEFDFVSDITTRSSTEWTNRNPLNCIAGEEGSLIHYWGGEIKRDNRTIYLYRRRGNDNVAIIRDGKNIGGLNVSYSTKGMVTKVIPYRTYTPEGAEEEITEYGTPVESQYIGNYPVVYVKAIDYSHDDSVTSLSDMNTKAGNYFTANNGIDKPSISVDVDLVELSDSSEYEKFKDFENVELFDTVTVYSKQYDIQIEAKITTLVYDSLGEKNISLEMGSYRTGLIEGTEREYRELLNQRDTDLVQTIQRAANGKNRIFRGVDEPTTGMVKNDIWYQPVGDGETMLYVYDGAYWQLNKVSAGLLGGTLDAENGDVNLINVNVANIVGNRSEFVQSYWNDINNQIKIDGQALTVSDFSMNETTKLENGRIVFTTQDGNHYWRAIPEGIALIPGGENTGDANNAGLWLRSTYYNYIDFGYGNDGGYGIRAAKRENWFEVLSKDNGDFRLVHGSEPSQDRQWNFQDGVNGSLTFGKTQLTLNGYDDTTFPRLSVLNRRNGEYAFISAAAFDVASDRSLKTDVEPLQNALGILADLEVYEYDKSGRREVGVIADESPTQMLSETGKSVNLYSYISLTHKALIELSEVVYAQEKKMEKLQTELIDLKAILKEKGLI